MRASLLAGPGARRRRPGRAGVLVLRRGTQSHRRLRARARRAPPAPWRSASASSAAPTAVRASPEIQVIIGEVAKKSRLRPVPSGSVRVRPLFAGDIVRLHSLSSDARIHRGRQRPPPAAKALAYGPTARRAPWRQGGPKPSRINEQGDHVVSNVHRPSLTVYLPAKHTGVSVIVVPGGGHRELWTDHEGHDIARFLNERGIAAFVLYYRLARAPNSTYTIDGDALNDLKRAIRIGAFARRNGRRIRSKIGAMGFLGGRATGGARCHARRRRRCGGERSRSIASRRSWISRRWCIRARGPISRSTPTRRRCGCSCGSDDRPEVIAGHHQHLSEAARSKVPAELHLYDGVPHGFGLRANAQAVRSRTGRSSSSTG